MASSDQKRAILAIFLSGMVLFVWQTYFAPKNPVPATPVVSESSDGRKGESVTPANQQAIQNNTQAENVNGDSASVAASSAADLTLSLEGHKVVFDSNLRIKNLTNPNQGHTLKETVGSDEFTQIYVDNGTGQLMIPNFVFKQLGQNRFSGTDSNLGLNIAGSLGPEGKLNMLLTSNTPLRYQLKYFATSKTTEDNRRRDYVSYTTTADRYEVGDDNKEELQLKWFATDFNYHIFATVFKKVTTSNLITYENGSAAINVIEPSNSLELEFLFTKKEYGHLKKLGSNLQNSVDFGFFGIVAVFILSGIQKVYEYIPNYGFAIIIITFLIRFVLFPLQYKSIKSMKNMQKIQPEIQKIREKYKDDQARLQKETMDLFRRTGANPLGGCLPMVMQMPVFFAFYQVLYNAVELVDAPFIFWIQDLSIKDPYYVLPVLMGISFFLQTKLNPTPTADPLQSKMMMAMPVVFTFIMKDLPAGLNLYFATSTIFGIAQQLIVYRFVK